MQYLQSKLVTVLGIQNSTTFNKTALGTLTSKNKCMHNRPG